MYSINVFHLVYFIENILLNVSLYVNIVTEEMPLFSFECVFNSSENIELEFEKCAANK